ncbi:acetamidase/formamidase family protein [Candidatus Latescibacterota bacterium]
MKRITRDQATLCVIDRRLPPVLRIQPQESFIVETEDAAFGYFRNEDTLPYPDRRPTHVTTPPRLNPVAGPIYIEGAEKGDVVIVTIEKIIPDTQGYTILQPEEGLLGNSLKYPKTADYYTRILSHSPGKSKTLSDGICRFNDSIRWDLAPHIGTLCCASEREVIASVNIQGAMGGNLDSRDFCEGSRLYLASYVEGGLLFVGDVHASQGDGELTGTANETRSEVILSCDIVKNKSQPHVRVEKKHSLIGLYCDKPLELAVKGAVLNLMDWLIKDYDFDEREAYLLIGICPETRINIYQMIDIQGLLYTAGVEIPKKYIL